MVEHTGGIVAVERLHVMDPRQLKVLKDKTKVLEAYPDFAREAAARTFRSHSSNYGVTTWSAI